MSPQPKESFRMFRLSRRHSHFVFGVLQSGLTSAVAAAVASVPLAQPGALFTHWLRAWLVAWVVMLPLVIFAAPFIRRLAEWLTQD
jgi:sterol desaturase/sphingolipid hydroxylase (fatty acid hydroxylase superfamily)